MKLHTRIVGAAALGPYVAGLRRLEADISYPIEDGRRRFSIDHGPDYHPFFSEMGEASFLVATSADGAVAGCLACVAKPARVGARALATAYLADLKIDPALRGRGVGRSLLTRALGHAFAAPRLLDWDLAYGVAMRGERGDVMRAVGGRSPAAAARVLARQHVYFAPPALLAGLDTRAAPAPPSGEVVLDLSARPRELFESTAGKKDLRVVGGGDLPLVHFGRGPGGWGGPHAAYLAAAARALGPRAEGALACFALDVRLAREVAFLGRAGVHPAAAATVWGLFRPLRLARRPRFEYVHVATSEI